MNEKERLDEIREALSTHAYVGKPGAILRVEEDVTFLLELIEAKTRDAANLDKKNQILLRQNMELTQEMENIRADFGGDMR